MLMMRTLLSRAFGLLALGFALLSLGVVNGAHAAGSGSCPDPSELIRPANPRGAIPAAKEALETKGRVLEVKRGPKSTYAASVKRDCGVQVLGKSIYVVVHPVGYHCSACNLHAYVVKYHDGPWEVFAGY
jgi:hypothetical protein